MVYKENIWGFRGTFFWGIVIGFVLMLGQLIPLYIYMLLGDAHLREEGFELLASRVERDAFLLAISIIGSAFIVVPFVVGVAKLKKGAILKEYFDLYLFSWRTFWFWFLVLVLLLAFESYAIAALGADEIPSFMMNIEYPSVSSIWLLVFAVVFFAPLVEELVFRGFLLKGFANSFLGVYGAVILTSALWAMVHMQYELAYVIVIFVVGLVFGYARVKSNSLLVPMMMHFFMNLVAALGLFYEKGML